MSCAIFSPADWKAAQSALPSAAEPEEARSAARTTIARLVRACILADDTTKRDTA